MTIAKNHTGTHHCSSGYYSTVGLVLVAVAGIDYSCSFEYLQGVV